MLLLDVDGLERLDGVVGGCDQPVGVEIERQAEGKKSEQRPEQDLLAAHDGEDGAEGDEEKEEKGDLKNRVKPSLVEKDKKLEAGGVDEEEDKARPQGEDGPQAITRRIWFWHGAIITESGVPRNLTEPFGTTRTA
jgi:hypothetical protein